MIINTFGNAVPIPEGPVGLFLPRPLKSLYPTIIYPKIHIVAFGTLLWTSLVLTSVALILRDIAGIGSAPRSAPQLVIWQLRYFWAY